RDYIDSGRLLVMTAHVLFGQIDAKWPATLSSRFLRDILRDELGFSGAIITDALDMKAVSELSPSQVAERFIEASGDLFCVCQDESGIPAEAALRFAKSLSQAASGNGMLRTKLNDSAARIELLLGRLRSTLATTRE